MRICWCQPNKSYKMDWLKRLLAPKKDFVKLLKDGAVIIDVRSKEEYLAGHIHGSRNIPLDTIKNEISALKKLDKPVITVCRSGNRSSLAKSILSSEGIEVYNGGAWKNLNDKIR